MLMKQKMILFRTKVTAVKSINSSPQNSTILWGYLYLYVGQQLVHEFLGGVKSAAVIAVETVKAVRVTAYMVHSLIAGECHEEPLFTQYRCTLLAYISERIGKNKRSISGFCIKF